MDSVVDDHLSIRYGRLHLVETAGPARASADSFEALYARHYRSVYRYVLGLTRSPADAEELTADTFERAFGTWARQPTPDSPLPWLLLTARRAATDRWRRARRLAALRIAGRPATASGAHEQTEFWIWFDAISKILSERQREVLLLRYQRDLSDADIASIMGLSQSGVRSLVSRALETLRAHPELL